jgi:hypothetical protein
MEKTMTNDYQSAAAAAEKSMRRGLKTMMEGREIASNVLRHCGAELDPDAVRRIENDVQHFDRVVTYATYALSGLPDDPADRLLVLDQHLVTLDEMLGSNLH